MLAFDDRNHVAEAVFIVHGVVTNDAIRGTAVLHAMQKMQSAGALAYLDSANSLGRGRWRRAAETDVALADLKTNVVYDLLSNIR